MRPRWARRRWSRPPLGAKLRLHSLVLRPEVEAAVNLLVDSEIEARVRRLELPFNRYGLDPYGVSRDSLAAFYSLLAWAYRHYFRVTCFGIENVPPQGRALLVGNHSGGLPIDAGMVLASLFLELEPPRHCHAMVEYFAQKWPFISRWFNRIGQFTGLPRHAQRFLREERLVMAFPEGARGTGKLYRDRYKLVRFGTGFMRMALKTESPIVPFAFIGGEEAIPTVLHLQGLARLIGAPYVPVPPQLLPIPLPVSCQIWYGEPMRFDGDGNEDDETIERYVASVRQRVEALIARGLAARPRAFDWQRMPENAPTASAGPRG